jgi:hypothetical protein
MIPRIAFLSLLLSSMIYSSAVHPRRNNSENTSGKSIPRCLLYTSVGCRSDHRLQGNERHYIFQLQGSIYHMQGPPLMTSTRHTLLFSQLYFLGPKEAVRARISIRPQLRRVYGLIEKLDNFLRRQNPFRHIFLRAMYKDVLDNDHADLDCLRLTPQLRLIPN